MNRLKLKASLVAGLALAILSNVHTTFAESGRIPVRSANARTTPSDPDDSPAANAPLPSAPIPSNNGPLPPPPVPDRDADFPPAPKNSEPAPGGGIMFRGPLGADFQRPEPPKKQYLGDDHPQARPANKEPRQPVEDEAANGPIAGTDPYGIAPPPGTLGRTYLRRTRLIDEERHPRMGVVEVHLSENYEVTAKGLKVKWTGKLWRLESDPLLPGIPHIYEVKAEWGPENARQQQVRSVRLIRGRIVDLDF